MHLTERGHTALNAIIGPRMTERERVTLSNHTFKVFDLETARLKQRCATLKLPTD